MRRRSGIPVLIRLAKLKERQALHALSRARGAVMHTQTSLELVADHIRTTRTASYVPSGQSIPAETLRLYNHCLAGLQTRASELRKQLEIEQGQEEEARTQVAQAKLHLQSIQNVADRRRARERLEKQRRDQKRADELTRGLRSGEDE